MKWRPHETQCEAFWSAALAEVLTDSWNQLTKTRIHILYMFAAYAVESALMEQKQGNSFVPVFNFDHTYPISLIN